MSKNNFRSTKNKIYFGVFAVIIGLFGITLLFQGRAAEQNPPPPTVYLTPTDITYGANQLFTVNIRANSGNTPVNAVGAIFSYPANLVDYVSTDVANSTYPTVAANEGGSGTVKLEAGLAAGATPVTGDKFIAKITFKTKVCSRYSKFKLHKSDTTFKLNYVHRYIRFC